ncbi:MAG: ribonuclease R [Verrucomicrobiaceae bacterium]|nr:ribonuclease R [Verrucomicrobiaceae bacterium]
MQSKLMRLFAQPGYRPSTAHQIAGKLRIDVNELQPLLNELERAGKIIRTKQDRYIEAREADLIPGVIQITRSGRGFVQPDQAGIGEIAIAERATANALHGDKVLVRLNRTMKGLRKQVPEIATGAVVKVLERRRTRFVGTFQRHEGFLNVVPDDPRLPSGVIVSEPRDVGRMPIPGDKVVVELVQWEPQDTLPEGRVVEVLGAPDAEGVDMLSVLRHYDLPLHFPEEVLAEAKAIDDARPDHQPSSQECRGRVDCRQHDVVTIDPDDAKDFDDAICIKREGTDKWRLWVHIADVSHYVKPGSALDKEARKRGNSTYLVDRVIPMLPEALSNELCSLKPNVDRLTKCVEFVLNDNGGVISSKFYAAVIRSKRRFTYQEAFEVLKRKARNEIESMLHDANHVAQAVRRERFKRGSLDLDFPEHKIRLNEKGRVSHVERMENDISHQLIEEYMLLANEAVAGRLMQLTRPAVYRVHEAPKEKKLGEYREEVLSHRVSCGDLTIRAEVQKLLARLAHLPIGPALKFGFLKSMMRARYATEPLGHYGLAKKKYTHFTSPIRRYADLIVHRALFEQKPLQHADLQHISDHLSTTERISSDAERDSRDVKMYAWLKGQIESGNRQTYTALITDIRNFGLQIEVEPLGMSGFVPLSAMTEDFFIFDPVRCRLVGKRTRRELKLADRIEVQAYRLDLAKKFADFTLVAGPKPSKPMRDKKRQAPNRKRR